MNFEKVSKMCPWRSYSYINNADKQAVYDCIPNRSEHLVDRCIEENCAVFKMIKTFLEEKDDR